MGKIEKKKNDGPTRCYPYKRNAGLGQGNE